VRNQLFVVFSPANEMVLNKLNEAVRVRVLLVVEVEAFRSLLDSDSLLVGLVLED
jgi:hypothetical protein